MPMNCTDCLEPSISSIPWIEKYRPVHFDNIVLDPLNRTLFENILSTKHFPNLLFYGPPGTGKTTTIINLINKYQNDSQITSKENVIHLNASDERGIDIIRNQINQFVKSRNMFEKGLKFVILDEVDYMTKNAQQALKTLLQSDRNNVRFCLICNYISKIDESLQNEFICIRFNQLPKQEIFGFIKNISLNEKLGLTDENIETIMTIYNSDIRSMINFMQLNLSSFLEAAAEDANADTDAAEARTKIPKIISNKIWNELFTMMNSRRENAKSTKVFEFIQKISIEYNIDKFNLLNMYFDYLLRHQRQTITVKTLKYIGNIMHSKDNNIENILNYFIYGDDGGAGTFHEN